MIGEQVYRELARKLDSIPPGFAATEDGLEVRVLAAALDAGSSNGRIPG